MRSARAHHIASASPVAALQQFEPGPLPAGLRRTLAFALSIAISVSFVGCGSSDSVRQVTVKKPVKVVGVIAVDSARNTLWRVHMQGPTASVERNTPVLREFMNSWTFDEATGVPTWTVPDVWSTQPISDGEFAIFGLTPKIIGDDMKRSPPETDSQRVVVHKTVVPEGVTAEEFAMGHMNQWRSEISVSPFANLEEFEKQCERTSVGDVAVVWLEALGREPDGSERNAFGAVRPANPQTPTRSEVDYQLPEGWIVSPNPSGFAVVTLDTEGGEGKAQITVTPLTAASSWEENVVRWIGQIGAEPIDGAAITQKTVEITVDGTPSSKIDLVGTDGAADPDRLIAVRVVRGDSAWFIRMRGNAKRIETEVAHFDEFLKSLDLPD